MKTERQIAEQLLRMFRNQDIKVDQGLKMTDLMVYFGYDLNSIERDYLFNTVFVGLQSLNYITIDEDGNLVRLTKKGYDFIYDDDLVKKMQDVPWVIPDYLNPNWVVAWNKLWKIIDAQPFYQSGPMFMKYICELDDSVETDYYKYMDFRRSKELSTSRKDYFRELVDNLDEKKRYDLYVKLQETFENMVSIIETNKPDLIPTIFESNDTETLDSSDKEHHPKVFISYSWDSEDHINWVLGFAKKLCEKGIDVILDQWEIIQKGGSLFPDFMINSVSSAERVLCIMTPNYKKKTDRLEGGVGFEYSILSSEIADDIKTTKFIPILREGDGNASTPKLLNKRVGYFMRNEDEFKIEFIKLLRDLYNEPKNVKPRIGPKPVFD